MGVTNTNQTKGRGSQKRVKAFHDGHFTELTVDARFSAFLTVDLWVLDQVADPNGTWAEMAQSIRQVLPKARKSGMQIVHAPSDTGSRYLNTKAASVVITRGPNNRCYRTMMRENPALKDHPADFLTLMPRSPQNRNFQSMPGCDCCQVVSADNGWRGFQKEECGQDQGYQYALADLIEHGDAFTDDRDGMCPGGVGFFGKTVYGYGLRTYLAERSIDTIFYTGGSIDQCLSWRAFGVQNMVKQIEVAGKERWGQPFRCIVMEGLTKVGPMEGITDKVALHELAKVSNTYVIDLKDLSGIIDDSL